MKSIPKKTQIKPEPVKKSIAGVIFNNAVAVLALFSLLYVVKKSNPGYTFIWDKLVRANHKMLVESKPLSDHEKNLYRHGAAYQYLSEIKAQTPENAVILMPSDSSIDKIDPNLKMENLKTKAYVSFFLYPRKPVYKKFEKDEAFMDKVEYVSIVSADDYKNVPVPPANKPLFTLVKIK